MKLIFTSLFVLTMFGYSLNAQTQGIAYTAVGKGVATTFVTDYHCLGINSSALGWGTGYEDKKFTLGMTEFSFGIYSDSLNSDKLKKLYRTIRNDMTGKEQDPANWAEQVSYAADYMRSGIMMDAQYNWFGFSYQSENFGGIAFNIQEHYNWYSRLSPQTTELIFEGKFSDYFDQLTVVYGTDTTLIENSGNISEDTLNHVVMGTITTPLMLSDITSGSEIRFAWNRYYNLGYGRKLFGDSTFSIFAGVAGRFIQSTAMFSMSSDEDGLLFYSSVSPSFDIDYGSVANTNPSNFTETGSIPKSVGNGYGLDFSVSTQFLNIFKVGLAVNNIGSVKYKRNVYRVKDSIVGDMTLDGLSNYNITGSLDQFLESGGILSLEGQEEISINNNANIRIGGSVDFGKRVSVGFDFVAPFNSDNPGGIQNPVYSFGGDVRPFKWLTLSAGYYGGGIYKHNIPVGINFVIANGTYEFGISSRDALAFFTKGSNSISTAFGIMRFRF